MKLGRTIALVSVVMGIAALASPGCGNSGLVGGGCADGFTNCSNRCVDLQIDQYNCGSCAHACTSGVACINGKCGGSDQVGGAGYGGAGGGGGHYRDGSTDGGDASSDAKGDGIVEFDVSYPQGGSTGIGGSSSGGDTATGGYNAGGSSAGGNSSAGATATGGTGEPDANPCVPPYNDPQHCGDCNNVCTTDKPVCAPFSGSYACQPQCDEPLYDCNGTCVDRNSDSNNCGGCGVVCPSGICQGGSCVGVHPGDFVGICMNYRAPATAQTTLLLGNSVFPPSVSTVRILAYDEYVDPLTRPQVDATISAAAGLAHSYVITSVHKNLDVPNVLRKSDYDVFLVYEQPKAPTGALSDIGDRWASALESYTYVGGVVVMLDGGQGIGEMSKLFTSTRIFPVSSEVILSPSTKLVRHGSDVIVQNMVTPFATQADTCVFETSLVPDSNTAFVITEPTTDAGTARPVAVHLTRIAPQQ